MHSIDGSVLEIPYRYPIYGDWGSPVSTVFEEPRDYEAPKALDLVYLSIVEKIFYSLEAEINTAMLIGQWQQLQSVVEPDSLIYLVVGLAPYGLVTLWIVSDVKSMLVSLHKAEAVEVEMSDFRASPDADLDKICKRYIDNIIEAKDNFEENGLPPRDLFDNYMKQFTYRYVAKFGKWNGRGKQWEEYGEKDQLPEFGWIEEALFDGTHDKLRDGGLMKYHEAGKPKKLAVSWHVGKAEYSAYFWFEDERIREVFDKFYGAHPDTKTDFVIRIDAERRKYELALYRYGLKEPQVIQEDVYQLLVFKNKFEDYRSENYNKERGAWVW